MTDLPKRCNNCDRPAAHLYRGLCLECTGQVLDSTVELLHTSWTTIIYTYTGEKEIHDAKDDLIALWTKSRRDLMPCQIY